MSRAKPDTLGLIAALERSIEQARALWPEATPTPDPCLCGSTDDRARIIAAPVDLTGEGDVTVQPLTLFQPTTCRACGHYIGRGALAVHLYYGDTTTVRDYFHTECVRL